MSSYRISSVAGTPYHPDRLRRRPKAALVANDRGVPCLVSDAEVHIHEMERYRLDAKWTLRPVRPVSLLATLAASSAYLAPLADRRMRRIVRAQYLGAERLFLAWQRWLQGGRSDNLRLAPPVTLHRAATVRCADGCLWDRSALASAVWGLHREGLLRARPVVVVLTARHTRAAEWWSGTRKRGLFPEPTLFAGKPRASYRRRATHTFVTHYAACTIDPAVASLRQWVVDAGDVDVLVVGVRGQNLNSFSFNKAEHWHRFRQRATAFFDHLRLDALVADRPLALALSGGGARMAVLGVLFLRHLRARHLEPRVIGATSGGAWAVALNATVPPTECIVETLLQRSRAMWVLRRWQQVGLRILRLLEGSERLETVTYLGPLLANHDGAWSAIVERLVDADWAQLRAHYGRCRLAFSTTILATV